MAKRVAPPDNMSQSQPVKKKKTFPRVSFVKKRNNVSKKTKKNPLKKKYSCEKCEACFANWWERRDHWLSSGHKLPEECRWCRKKTFTLQSHLCKQHWNLASMCQFCGDMFMYQQELDKHLLNHDGLEYRCHFCGRRRKNTELLRSHVYSHYLHEKYGCNVCEKRFKKKNNLEKHLKSDHFICQYCGNVSETQIDLKKHTQIHDDLKCVFCNKVFSQKNRLKYHYQLKHGHQDFFKCSFCFRRFVLKFSLIEHIKLKHKGVSNFSCDLCDVPFLHWQQYVNHFENHINKEGVVKFKCSFCDYETDKKCKLEWHVEKTTGSGFFCKKCQVPLECRTIFENHMKLHKGEKVWACDYCDNSYTSDSVLSHHMTVAHRERVLSEADQVFPCLIMGCDTYYFNKNSLSRHLRKSHPEDMNSDDSKIFKSSSKAESFITDTPASSHNSETPQSPSVTDVSVSPPSPSVIAQYTLDVDSTVNPPSPVATDISKGSESPSSLNKTDIPKSSSNNNVVSEGSTIQNEVASQSKIENSVDESEQDLSKDSAQTNSQCSSNNVSLSNEKQPEVIEVDVYYCAECEKWWFANSPQFRKHMRTHKKKVWDEKCKDCNVLLDSPEEAVKHYVVVHLKVKYVE